MFEEFGAAPRGKTCDAIMGLLEEVEGQEVMKEFKGIRRWTLVACWPLPRQTSIMKWLAMER